MLQKAVPRLSKFFGSDSFLFFSSFSFPWRFFLNSSQSCLFEQSFCSRVALSVGRPPKFLNLKSTTTKQIKKKKRNGFSLLSRSLHGFLFFPLLSFEEPKHTQQKTHE